MGWCGRRALLPAVKRVGNRECTITAMRLDGRSMGGVNIRPNVLEAMWLPCLFTILFSPKDREEGGGGGGGEDLD